MKQSKKVVAVRLPPEVSVPLQQQAAETCRSLPNYILWILRRYLAAFPDGIENAENSPKFSPRNPPNPLTAKVLGDTIHNDRH